MIWKNSINLLPFYKENEVTEIKHQIFFLILVFGKNMA